MTDHEHVHRFRWTTKACECGQQLDSFAGPVAHFAKWDGPTEMEWHEYLQVREMASAWMTAYLGT